jgi:hypothetical protein
MDGQCREGRQTGDEGFDVFRVQQREQRGVVRTTTIGATRVKKKNKTHPRTFMMDS